MSIGNQIMAMRRERQLTQEQFGSLFHVTRQTVSNWENGKSYPDLQLLVAISDQFGVSLDTLLKEDTKMVKAIDRERGLRVVKRKKAVNHFLFHCRLFDDTHRLVEAVTLGRKIAFRLGGERGRENLIPMMRAPTVWPVLSSMLETFAGEEVQGRAQKRRLLQVLFAREKGSVCEQ